jgi:predicted AAA+ superfamily ATPase
VLSAYPETLRQTLRPEETMVIIDEVQKLPALLDEAQSLIDRNPKLRFILTGSSARKLKARSSQPAGGPGLVRTPASARVGRIAR